MLMVSGGVRMAGCFGQALQRQGCAAIKDLSSGCHADECAALTTDTQTQHATLVVLYELV